MQRKMSKIRGRKKRENRNWKADAIGPGAVAEGKKE